MSSRPFDSIVIDIDFIRLCSPANWSDLSCFAIRGAPARQLYLILSIKLRKLFSFILRLLLVHVSTFGIREQKPTQEKKLSALESTERKCTEKKICTFLGLFSKFTRSEKNQSSDGDKKAPKKFSPPLLLSTFTDRLNDDVNSSLSEHFSFLFPISLVRASVQERARRAESFQARAKLLHAFSFLCEGWNTRRRSIWENLLFWFAVRRLFRVSIPVRERKHKMNMCEERKWTFFNAHHLIAIRCEKVKEKLFFCAWTFLVSSSTVLMNYVSSFSFRWKWF